MLALSLALASCMFYGTADFLGGHSSRHVHVVRVIVITAPASLIVELALLPLLGATWSTQAVVWGAMSGVASAAALALLYRCLALGPMSVLSPLTALVSALLPLGVGLATGERLGLTATAGVVLALTAVVLVTTGPAHAVPSLRALLIALGAGGAIALQLICLSAAPTTSGLAPLIVGRSVASVITLTVAMVLWRRTSGTAGTLPAAAAGVLDSLANLAFLEASRNGQLAVVAVVVALYPAVTIALARSVLRERLHIAQWGGLTVAAGAACLLAVS